MGLQSQPETLYQVQILKKEGKMKIFSGKPKSRGFGHQLPLRELLIRKETSLDGRHTEDLVKSSDTWCVWPMLTKY